MKMVEKGQRLVFLVLYENGGSDQILCDQKSLLTSLGFSQEMYESRHSNMASHDIQTVSRDLAMDKEIFPTQDDCDMFKKSGSSWFIMRRAEVKLHYFPDPAAFATRLEEVLGTSLDKFDPKKHDKFFRV
jgi:hypothetical protein